MVEVAQGLLLESVVAVVVRMGRHTPLASLEVRLYPAVVAAYAGTRRLVLAPGSLFVVGTRHRSLVVREVLEAQLALTANVEG